MQQLPDPSSVAYSSKSLLRSLELFSLCSETLEIIHDIIRLVYKLQKIILCFYFVRFERLTEESAEEAANNPDASSVGRSSRHSRKPPQSCGDRGHIGPAATSSPLDEKSHSEAIPHERSSHGSIDDRSSQRRRQKKSRPDGNLRTSPSDRSFHENRSEGRRSSAKSGSRLSKTKPRQYNCSTSEESYPTNRPDRVNSSVYSEQDKVPSLINHPKSNVYGSRHRPNTADSNLDSGFVGSEGTLKSQELSNGGKTLVGSQLQQTFSRQLAEEQSRRPESKGTQSQASSSRLKSYESHYQASEPRNHLGQSQFVSPQSYLPPKQSNADSVRSADRVSQSTRRSKSADQRQSKQSPEPSNYIEDHPVCSSVATSKPSTRLKEKARGHNHSDDVISFQTTPPEMRTDASYQRLPVRSEKSPFPATIRLEELDVQDNPVRATGESQRDNFGNLREKLNVKKHPRSQRSSFASYPEPKLSVYIVEDDSYSRLPDTPSPRIKESVIPGGRRERRSSLSSKNLIL